MHRRYTNVVGAVAVLLTAAGMTAHAQPLRASGPRPILLEVGAGPGFWLNGAPVSFELGVHGGLEFPLANRLVLRALLPFEFMSSGSEDAGVQVTNVGVGLVPRAEAAIELVRDVALRVGAGIGPAFFRNTVTFRGEQTFTGTRMEIDLLTGMEYRLMDRLAIFLDPVRLRILPGTEPGLVRVGGVFLSSPATPVAWTVLGGAAVRL